MRENRPLVLNSIAIIRATLRLLRRHPRFLVFPFAIGPVVASLLIAFAAPIVYALYAPAKHQVPGWVAWLAALPSGRLAITPLGWAVALLGAVIFYFLAYFVVVFFGTALTRAALVALRGEPVSLRGSLAFAASRYRAILAYTAIVASVGLVCRVLEAVSDNLGRVAAGLFGMAWTYGVHLAIPVLVQEDRGGLAAIRRSGELLRRTWGATLLGRIGLGLIWVPVALVLALIAGLAVITNAIELAWLFLLFCLLLLVVLPVVSMALHAIFRAALYTFAVEGVVPSDFDVTQLHQVWEVRGPRGE